MSKKAIKKSLVAMTQTLLERTSLASSVLQSASIFDPQNLLQMSKEKANGLFKSFFTNIILTSVEYPSSKPM